MEKESVSFERLIREDRAAHSNRTWQGRFLDYLELLKADASVPKLAHHRLHRGGKQGPHGLTPRHRFKATSRGRHRARQEVAFFVKRVNLKQAR